MELTVEDDDGSMLRLLAIYLGPAAHRPDCRQGRQTECCLGSQTSTVVLDSVDGVPIFFPRSRFLTHHAIVRFDPFEPSSTLVARRRRRSGALRHEAFLAPVPSASALARNWHTTNAMRLWPMPPSSRRAGGTFAINRHRRVFYNSMEACLTLE